MNLQEHIKKILREERKLSSSIIRRLDMLDYEVKKNMKGPLTGSSICIFFKSDIEYLESIMENSIDYMYYKHFSHIDDGSGEWAHTYLDMVDYIRKKYKSKIMKHYDDNCGSGSIPLKESIRRVLREEKLHATPQELIKNLPNELKELLFKQWDAKQNPEWHPEGNTLKHIIVVIKRAYHHYPDDPNMVMAALFHDLGKIDTYKINPKTNQPTAYGHEDKSTDYVEKFKDWIESFEGMDVEEIKYLVKNHMKVKPSTWDQMKDKKKEPIISHPAFDKLMGFTDKLDGGGTDLKESIRKILREESNKDILIDGLYDPIYEENGIVLFKEPKHLKVYSKFGIKKSNVISGKEFNKKYVDFKNKKLHKVLYKDGMTLGGNLGEGKYWCPTEYCLSVYLGETHQSSEYSKYVKEVVDFKLGDDLKILVKKHISDDL